MTKYEIILKTFRAINGHLSETEYKTKLRNFEKELKKQMWKGSTMQSQTRSYQRFTKGLTKKWKPEWTGIVERLLGVEYMNEVFASNELININPKPAKMQRRKRAKAENNL